MTGRVADEEHFWLRIRKRVSGGHAEWLAEEADNVVTLRTPAGAKHEVSGTRDTLACLEVLACADPELPVVRRHQTVNIECAETVSERLPLWLQPSDEALPEPPAGAPADAIQDVEDVEFSSDHELTVNGQEWRVISSEPYAGDDPATRLIAVPYRGPSSGHLTEQVWAGYEWSETGSMTSGLDWSLVGWLNPALAILIDGYDERRVVVKLIPSSDPVASVREWLRDGRMSGELRTLWRANEASTDFIEHGLRLLAQTDGGTSVRVTGPYGPEGTEVIGLTNTSVWNFYGSLTPTQWAAVLDDPGRTQG